MNEDTLIYLKKLGIKVPVCQNCRSEDFEDFTANGEAVINCNRCNSNFENERGDQRAAPSSESQKTAL